MAAAFNLKEGEFSDIVAGINWLDKSANKRLYGTAAAPGPLYAAFDEVNGVLRRNRPEVYVSKSSDYLTRDFIEEK